MLIYSGRKFEVIVEDQKLPNNEEAKIEMIKHDGSVVIIPFLNEEEIILLWHYRPVIKNWLYELPAGTLKKNEDPLEAAKRELLEETGYFAEEIREMYKFYPSPGISTELMYVFVAKKLIKGRQKLEKDEVLEIVKMKLKEAIEMIKNKEIIDGKTALALLYYINLRS